MSERLRHDQNRLGHLLWETSNVISQMAETQIAEPHLRSSSVGAMSQIQSAPGVSVSEMARASLKSQQAVSQTVARLERLGFVERRLRPGRGIGLHLTAAGEHALAEGDAREEQFESDLRELLGDDRYTQLRRLLQEARPLLAQAREGACAESDQALTS